MTVRRGPGITKQGGCRRCGEPSQGLFCARCTELRLQARVSHDLDGHTRSAIEWCPRCEGDFG